MRRRSSLIAALALLLLTAPGVLADSDSTPVVSRSELSFALPVNACGVGTLDVTIDAMSIVDLATNPDGTSVARFAVIDVGTGVDEATGDAYRFVDRFTDRAAVSVSTPSVTTAERTFVLAGPSGGILSRGLVHTTVMPDGTMASDVSVQFVACH